MSTRSMLLPKIGERYHSRQQSPLSVSDFLSKAGLHASPSNTRELAIVFNPQEQSIQLFESKNVSSRQKPDQARKKH